MSLTNKKPLVVGNWKMNTIVAEAIDLSKKVATMTGNLKAAEIVICPPSVWLVSLAANLKDTDIKLGAQNMYWQDKGAYTGELSASMLKSAGCDYVIIGHSERRQYFGENDQIVNLKLKKAVAQGLIPIVCLGESLREREAGKTRDVITRQFKQGFEDFDDFEKVVVAYEPVWAIGTGLTATPEQAQEVHSLLRELLCKNAKVKILYGGSVKPGNAAALFAMDDIDGFLVGGASLKADDFVKIIKATASG